MKKIAEWWDAHFMGAEFVVWALATGSFIAWSHRFGGVESIDKLLESNRSAVYGALASIFGSLLGFVITTFSIILGFAGSERLEVLRGSAHYLTLWSVYKSAVRVLAVTTLAALAGLVFDRETAHNRIAMYITLAGFMLSIVRLSRAVWILERVTDILTEPSKERTAAQP